MPPSYATDVAISASNAGHYPSSFTIQSQIGHHQRNLANSVLASERRLAPRAGEIKRNMIDQLSQTLRNHGLNEEADLLHQGINNYRQYQRVRERLMPIFKTIGIPTTSLALLGLGLSNKPKKLLSKLVE